MSGSAPLVSVVVPTRDRAALLLRLLERLAAQDLGRERFELVVVCDGCSDRSAELARERGAALGLRLEVLEPSHGGPAAARNHGIAAARAPVVAFTDDDVLPTAGWLRAGLEAFGHQRVGGVEGLTRGELGPDCLYKGNISNLEGGLYPTCNMFYRRELLQRLGGFDPGFERYSDDSDLAWRVQDAGYQIVFADGAEVEHHSHLDSPWLPFTIASRFPDTLRLWRRHPRRQRLRPWFYRSDLIKLLLTLGLVAGAVAGRPWLAAGCGLALLLLVLRSLRQEVWLYRAWRRRLTLALLLSYTLAPWVNLWWLLMAVWRNRATPVLPQPG